MKNKNHRTQKYFLCLSYLYIRLAQFFHRLIFKTFNQEFDIHFSHSIFLSSIFKDFSMPHNHYLMLYY